MEQFDDRSISSDVTEKKEVEAYNKIHPKIQRIRRVQVRATSKPFRAEGHPAVKR